MDEHPCDAYDSLRTGQEELINGILAGHDVLGIMPYLLSFAAGAMIYVVIEELVPEMSEGGHSNRATIAFMVGFCLMMTLDVMLG